MEYDKIYLVMFERIPQNRLYNYIVFLICCQELFDRNEAILIKMSSVARAFGIVIGIALIVLAVFLAVTSMLFSFGSGSAPDIFGYNVYIVQDNDFYQLKAGTAAIAQKVWPDEVNDGELIIYNRYENGWAQLAKVNSSMLKEGVMSFDIETQSGENTTISQSQLVARVNYCSDFLGAVIGFAMSPFGVMAIAILPCLAIVAFEIVKFIFSKRPVPKVEPVKLQEETPVYAPVAPKEQEQVKININKAKIPALSDKPGLTHKPLTDGTHSKTDEFTDRLRLKQNAAVNADEVKDRTDFSVAARRRMSEDRALTEKTEKTAEVVFKTAAPDGKPAHKPAFVPEKKETDKKTAPVKTEKPAAGSEPDISLVFQDEDDKRYDIDDILADIEKRHH